jgi:hypothetical protein
VLQRGMNGQPSGSFLAIGLIWINGPFLFGDKGMPAEYAAGLDCAISLGWLQLHESGTFVKLTQSGVDLFA